MRYMIEPGNINMHNSYAHCDTSGRKELLHEHLKLVAKRAAEYASHYNADHEAYIAGLFHDLGKYGELFQRRLIGKEKNIDHWSAGAWFVLQKYRYIAAAMAIQGHHVGLQACNKNALLKLDPEKLKEQHPLNLKLSENDIDKLIKHLKHDSLPIPEPNTEHRAMYPAIAQTAAAMLDVRMLFSALVDADFIETEAWFEMDENRKRRYRESGLPLEPAKALGWLQSYLHELTQKPSSSSSIQKLRTDLLNACLEAASSSPGLFTLTAPTGSGKTLSMLAFALTHAAKYNLRRIIVVIPYLTIIEQTVQVYRQFLAQHMPASRLDRYILEHHSLSGIRTGDGIIQEDEDYGKRLLAENWDAPIIVTTNVQFLESLFSNRPSACRKLHRLAKSVILFDEVQTLPVSLAIPTLATLSHLAERYHSTIVFATATQPAFNHLDKFVRQYCTSGWQPREIIPKAADLFSRAKRVTLKWPDRSISWSDLTDMLVQHKQVMCVVNLKRHAKNLFDTLRRRDDQPVFHLSTNMCPAHRQEVLAKVRLLLDDDKPCRLIATQCVEVGVDIDFPVVYRALGPLDAIAQAAGRCNRNGLTASGEVYVFKPELEDERRPYPDGAYEQATDITKLLLAQLGVNGMDISEPELFQKYYRTLYDFACPEKHKKELIESIKLQDFSEVSKQYRVISRDAINVLVPYNTVVFSLLREKALKEGLCRQWIIQARPYSVSLFRPKANDPLYLSLETIKLKVRSNEESDEWYIYRKEEDYDQNTGLNTSLSPDVIIA